MNSMKSQKDMTRKDELPRSVGAQYATGDQWRNNSRKNEGMEPKQTQHPAVDVTSDRSNFLLCYTVGLSWPAILYIIVVIYVVVMYVILYML